jgi:Spy/CpxP family protein refolding chaperone
MMKALGLSEDQQKQMKALRSAQQKEQIRLKAEVKIAHLELRDLVQQANGPSGAVATKVAKVGELQSRLLKQRVDFQLKRKAVLTDEQRKKLEVLRSVPPARQDGRWRGRAESRGREK